MKKAILVDDEQPAIDKLSNMLKATGLAETVSTFTEPVAAIEYVRKNKIDIAFLDIEMPGMNGLELADRIMELNSKTHIIFVTAFNEYAVEAFKIHALDYLMKPVEKERLLMALERIPDIKPPPKAKRDIRVSCFGKFKVTLDGQEIKFRTAKAEEMLALFIDRNKTAIHRNTIMDLFWMDSDGDRATILFNTTLHYLKKAFLQQGGQLKIDYDRGAYMLDMPGIYSDSNYFVSAIQKLQPASEENIKDYEILADIYTGNYLEQNEYDWAEQKRIYFKKKYAGLILTTAEYYQRHENFQKVIDILYKGLRHDPLNKDLNHCLLKTFYLNRDEVSLIKHYGFYKSALYSEFGVEPDEDSRKLISSLS